MARDFIKIDPTQSAATQARALLSYITTLASAIAQGKQILAVMGHNNDGTIFTDIETLYGLPAGKGQTLFNLVNGSVGSFAGTFQVADATTITVSVG
jgi:hypothetical protein